MLTGTENFEYLDKEAEDNNGEQIEYRLSSQEIRDSAQESLGELDHVTHSFSRPPIVRMTHMITSY